MSSKSVSSQCHVIGAAVNEELRRLASYHHWPSSAGVRPSALSRCGFTYEGEGERTRCVACGIVVDNWLRGDRPQDVHRSRSPRCPFVLAESSSSSQDADESASARFQQLRVSDPQASIRTDGEIPMSTTASSYASSSARGPSAGPSVQQPSRTPSSMMFTSSIVDRSHPDFVQLRSESARLSTFDDWPLSAGRIVQPRDLAAAGLFYTGHADRVQCAFCRGCLRRWREGDVPAQEHRRHFPDCPLVRGTESANVRASDGSTTRDSQLAANQPQLPHLSAGELDVKTNVDDSENVGSGSMMTVRPDAANAVPASSLPLTAPAAVATIPAALATEDATMDIDEDCEVELQENRRLREARTCKVCMDSEVNTVFLPCGHLVCCDTCSPELRNCAVCRALIRGTVKVFLG